MKKIIALILLAQFAVISTHYGFSPQKANNENDKEVLFTYGNVKVTKDEFSYIYEKNNVGKEANYSERSIREYLTLYINFRLKVAEAEELGLDTIKSINKELATYRKQLAKSYMADKDIVDRLIKEVYDRLQKEINVSHIMIEVNADASPEDTLKAYKELLKVRKQILKGADFATKAREISGDKSAIKNGGNLGYFTALQMLYPFETKAYNTPKGEISKPVRTQFGYHIIRVEDIRPSRGEILTAHIFIKSIEDATEAEKKEAKERAEKVYKSLVQGEDFGRLAGMYSDDKATAGKGGKLSWFGVGRMVSEFENAAFALKNIGDFTKPVLTSYGWHIIKLLDKRELESFEDMKSKLRDRIKKDQRIKIVDDKLLKTIKKEYNYTISSEAYEKLYEKFNSTLSEKTPWKVDDLGDFNGTLFTLLDKKYTIRDFGIYIERLRLMKRQYDMRAIFDDIFKSYEKITLTEFEESQLENKSPEFKSLMKEYRDGILLFELTDKKVWSKALEDTIGLKEFFNNNRQKYQWNERINAKIYKCESVQAAEFIKEVLKNENFEDELEPLRERLHLKKLGTVEIEEGTFEKGQHSITDQILWKMGFSSNIKNELGEVFFVRVLQLLDSEPKKLHEAKGYVVADYQEYLEKEWIKSLRDKYPVKINETVLKSLVQ